MENDSRKLFDKAIDLSNGIRFNPKKLKIIYGVGIDEDPNSSLFQSFDFIISRAVLEHIFRIDKAFSFMNEILVEGGYMIHKIDFRDHGMFSNNGMHPLTFLTIPDSIYRFMTIYSGSPNRKLISYYKMILKKLGFDYKILITSVLNRGKELKPYKEMIELNKDFFEKDIKFINKIRNKLSKSYYNMSNEDLLTTGIYIIAKKPKN